MNSLYTALQFALALGKSKRAVQLALSGIPADSVALVRGQQADGWFLTSLPHRFLQQLDTRAVTAGYRNAEHLLSDPPARFAPVDRRGTKVPIADIAAQYVERAHRLRQALALSLEKRDSLTTAETKQAAFTSFRAAWGSCDRKTWNRMLERTIRRDAGEERFEDLALYFDKIVTRRAAAREKIASPDTAAEWTVLAQLAETKDLAKPTLAERGRIWEAILRFIDDAIQSGEKQKRAMRRAFKLLGSSGITLSKTDSSLKWLIKHRFQKWVSKGRTFAAIEDQRPHKSGRKARPIPAEDRKKLIGHIVKGCGGRVSQGYRELRNAGALSFELTTRAIANSMSKSYVPPSVRRAITGDVRRLKNIHRGEREHKLLGAYHSRDWSGMAAGDFFQSDDLTAPVYFYKEDGELTRGQFLPMIDERTSMILGFVLIQEKTYNSLSIRSLITNVCSVHGLPRRGFAFERGIWKSSKILTGSREAQHNEIADMGLRRLGMEIRHALLPKAKVIERLLGQLQNMMEGLPGYCGRNEQLEKLERFNRARLDVSAGRADPHEHFLSAAEMKAAFAEIVGRYNREPQQGKRLDGLSPDEAWASLQGDEPRTRFDDKLLYFLASDVRRLKVGRNGLTITIGKQRFNYKGTATGARQGETVLAWWNPERPELLTCTEDFAGKGVFTVERSYDVPAFDAPRDLLAEENRKVKDHNRYARNLYHIVPNPLPASAFRGQLAGRDAVQLGETIKRQQGEATARQKKSNQLDASLLRQARKAHLPAALVHRDEESLGYLDEYNAGLEEISEALAKEKEDL